MTMLKRRVFDTRKFRIGGENNGAEIGAMREAAAP
jgi:hypothetical protein